MTILIPFVRAAFAPLLVVAALSAQAQTATPSSPTPAPTDAEKATLDAAFKQADVDKDGKLSNAELVQIPVLATQFAALDKNRDGYITPDEFNAGVTVKP